MEDMATITLDLDADEVHLLVCEAAKRGVTLDTVIMEMLGLWVEEKEQPEHLN
jgi:hypothetical protein